MNYDNFRAVLDYIELKDDGENILKDPVIRLFPSDAQVNWFNFKLPFILVCLYLIFFLSLFHSFIVLHFFQFFIYFRLMFICFLLFVDSQEDNAPESTQPLHEVINEALTKHWNGLKFREWNAGNYFSENKILP